MKEIEEGVNLSSSRIGDNMCTVKEILETHNVNVKYFKDNHGVVVATLLYGKDEVGGVIPYGFAVKSTSDRNKSKKVGVKIALDRFITAKRTKREKILPWNRVERVTSIPINVYGWESLDFLRKIHRTYIKALKSTENIWRR